MSHYYCDRCRHYYDNCTCADDHAAVELEKSKSIQAEPGPDADAWKCNKERFCAALEPRIEAEANQRSKGIVSVLIGNFRTGEKYTPGVCYKLNAKDGGLMFNFCPFCGVNLDALFARAPTATTG